MSLKATFPATEIEYFQSNCEGAIIDKIHALGYDTPSCEGIVINPGAYAHYSYAIADAISSIQLLGGGSAYLQHTCPR